MFSKETIKNLPNNNRFYVLAISFLVSIFMVCWLRVQVADDQLYYIQLEQTFGFLSVAFLYVTLLISPVKKIIGKHQWMENMVFARRATGISVFYFAVLHASVSLWGQLGGWSGLALLPNRFIWSLVFGTFALLILFIMVLTSEDKIIIWMTFPRWKRLQRVVYLCGMLIIVHVWMIGAHFSPGVISSIGFIALLILFGLQSWRMGGFLIERYHLSPAKKYFLFAGLWLLWIGVLSLISFSRPAGAHMVYKDAIGGAGAVLHIDPNDDPVAGERAALLFDVQGTLGVKGQPVAKLTIIDEQNYETEVPVQLHGNTVAANYTFPRQGLYMIMLKIEEGGKQTHDFMQSQRVSRGRIQGVTGNSAPLWAVVGTVGAGAGVIVVITVAFSRWKAINTYSKL